MNTWIHISKGRSKILVSVAILMTSTAFAQTHITRKIERGVGPFTVQTKRGVLTLRLLRREKDLVWADQLISSGQYVETGIETKDITKFDMPHIKLFDIAPMAKTTEQITQMLLALRKISEPLKAFRDLTGIPVDESLYLQAGLLEKSGRWREALALYEDILEQPYKPDRAAVARLRAGVCEEELQQHAKALDYFKDQEVPDDDLDILSAVYFARAKAKEASGLPRDALMDFMYLVVFHPFVQTNEARCLSAAMPCYAAIEEWDGMSKTLEALRKQYPDSAETKQAEEFATKFEDKIAEQNQYATPSE